MSMGRSKPATLNQALQFDDLWHIGCLACYLQGIEGHVPPEHDHRNTGDLAGMKRKGGHDATLPFCQWHHRGIPFDGYGGERGCYEYFGPSKHLHKKQFIAKYGSIDELYELRDRLLERYRAATYIRSQGRS